MCTAVTIIILTFLCASVQGKPTRERDSAEGTELFGNPAWCLETPWVPGILLGLWPFRWLARHGKFSGASRKEWGVFWLLRVPLIHNLRSAYLLLTDSYNRRGIQDSTVVFSVFDLVEIAPSWFVPVSSGKSRKCLLEFQGCLLMSLCLTCCMQTGRVFGSIIVTYGRANSHILYLLYGSEQST